MDNDRKPDPAARPLPADLEWALSLSVPERLRVVEELIRQCRRLNPDRPPPFAKSFESFDEYETWRLEQDKPWLY